MKSKDLQKIVFSKYQNSDGPSKIFRDLHEGLCLKTINSWCKMIRETGTIELTRPSRCPRIIRTQSAIQKVKNRMKGGKTSVGSKIVKWTGHFPNKYQDNIEKMV